MDINYPMVNEYKDYSYQNRIKQIDSDRNIFGRFDFHFDPEIPDKEDLAYCIDYYC